ncbi:hypothetical protein Tco_0516332 [Tanacetum coccineum]
MALTNPIWSSCSQLQLTNHPPSTHIPNITYTLIRAKCHVITLRNTSIDHVFVQSKNLFKSKDGFKTYCTKSTEERATEIFANDDDNDDDEYREDSRQSSGDVADNGSVGYPRRNLSSDAALNLGIREPVYEGIHYAQGRPVDFGGPGR